MSNAARWRALVVVAVVAGAAALALREPVRLGLDLRGGTQVVLEAKDTPRVRVDADVVARTLEVLRRRVDALGVAEPTLQRSGSRRIIVELPGVADPDEAVQVIGRTAQLAFRPVLGTEHAGTDHTGTTPGASTTDGGGAPQDPAPLPPGSAGNGDVLMAESGERLRLGPPALTGDAVGSARAVIAGDFTANWQVEISFRGNGGRAWAELTAEAACSPTGDPRRRIAIVLDREVISSPEVSPEIRCGEGITGGRTVITGRFTEREAKDLALLIRAGALPVPVEIVEQRTIGPTLGKAAIQASVRATLIGASLTVAYMVAYYRLLGVLATAALLTYALIAYAALLAVGATLTLPGIAGFVLAVGMAVDANILVFERAKDEHEAGRTLRTAIPAGFRRAWSAIADSNATTLLAAVLLFFYASGAVRGFGVTLSIGVIASMFTALVVTRLLTELALRFGRLTSRPALTGVAVGRRFRSWLVERQPDILGRRAWWFAASAVALTLALVGIGTKGLRLGLEFEGGRLVELAVERQVDLESLRQELAARGVPRALVHESGDGNVTIRTAHLTAAERARLIDAVAARAGQVEIVRDELVGPTIGAELRRKALIALALALVGQMAYLAVRFRWTYAAAAVIAMAHDVTILLGVFAWLGKELDGVFLAALLTVIGYSINDSVVVFDRIREHGRNRGREALAKVANEACLHTIPRTINTGLGALFILVTLWALGGATLTDFALALVVGIVVGTWSSVFTAAPLALVLEGEGLRAGTAPARSPEPAPNRRPLLPTGAGPSGPGPGHAAGPDRSAADAPVQPMAAPERPPGSLPVPTDTRPVPDRPGGAAGNRPRPQKPRSRKRRRR